jgi:hypothetical protein
MIQEAADARAGDAMSKGHGLRFPQRKEGRHTLAPGRPAPSRRVKKSLGVFTRPTPTTDIGRLRREAAGG